jgi:Icc-related predicted phosphoesterase
MTRIVCISDTHGYAPGLPEGDVLVHAGDLTPHGSTNHLRRAAEWISKQPFKYKIAIAGNHDWGLYREDTRRVCEEFFRSEGINYLCDEGIELEGLRFWGSPWVPEYGHWAFMRPENSPDVVAAYRKIPTGIDVLITHTPPYGILDRTDTGVEAGSKTLLTELVRIGPRVHVFGHIHEGHGQVFRYIGGHGTMFVNASTCNVVYEPMQAPMIIDIFPGPCIISAGPALAGGAEEIQ